MDGGGTPAAKPARGSAAVAQLRNLLGSGIEVRGPAEAEEPILAPNARAAVFDWLGEMRAREALKAAGLRPRSTALLHGPPGCGKTTMAHHMAARLGIPMVLIGAENIHSSAYHGESENNVARLFDKLRDCNTPCVVFMDEMESWGGKRDQNTRGGADNARTSTLGVILRKIEEFSGLLMAATNREKDIDPALWRRFGLQIAIDLPTEEERFAILARYLRPFILPDQDLDLLVELSEGASPALLRGLMEGVKRAIVMAAALNRPLPGAVAVFGRVLASLRPPPDLPPPPLWHASGAEALAELAWPPERAAPA